MDTDLDIDVREIAEIAAGCQKLSDKERQQIRGIVVGMRLAREAAGVSRAAAGEKPKRKRSKA